MLYRSNVSNFRSFFFPAPSLNCRWAALTITPTMTWLDSLERRFGRFAIPGLIRIIVALTALVYILALLNPGFLNVLTLEPRCVFCRAKCGDWSPIFPSHGRSVSRAQ